MIKEMILAGSLALVGPVVADELLVKPNPSITFGDLCSPDDPDFVNYRYPEKIPYCYRNVSFHRKARIYDAYAVPTRCRDEYTIDHFIPLAIGGSNKPQNLWPEHKHVKATRQNLEQELFEQVRVGKISQERAIEMIVEAKQNPPSVIPWKCR